MSDFIKADLNGRKADHCVKKFLGNYFLIESFSKIGRQI